MNLGDNSRTTAGRYKINKELMPRLATMLKDGDEVLYIGTNSTWDYKTFFWNPSKECPFLTIDISEQFSPDIVGNIEEMPHVESGRFSAVIMIGIYEFLNHPEKAFEEIKRVLRPGGILFVAFPGKGYYNDNRGVTPQESLDLLYGMIPSEMHLLYEGKEVPNSIIVFARKK